MISASCFKAFKMVKCSSIGVSMAVLLVLVLLQSSNFVECRSLDLSEAESENLANVYNRIFTANSADWSDEESKERFRKSNGDEASPEQQQQQAEAQKTLNQLAANFKYYQLKSRLLNKLASAKRAGSAHYSRPCLLNAISCHLG